MRLTAVMMWFDEPVQELTDQVLALKGFAHRLVAVDGAWDGFTPGRMPASRMEQHDAILRAASRADLDVTVHRPARFWPGEVAHRNYALQLALTDADWIFLFDADERVSSFEPDLHDRLATTNAHVGSVKFHTLPGPHIPATQWEKPGQTSEQRRLFRASPDLRFDRHHWWLRTDRLALWGTIPRLRFARAEFMQVHVQHRTCVRSDDRWERKRRFIAVRDPADKARGYEL